MEDKKINKEELEENNSIEVNDEVISKEEVIDIKDETTVEEVVNVKEDSKATKFIKKVLSGIIDQIISIASALILLIIFDLILRIFGFYIAEREPMFLIMYIIVNIFYTPICTSTKLKETIGRKIILK